MKQLKLVAGRLIPALSAFVLLGVLGCETQADRDKLAAAQKEFENTANSLLAESQWKLDKATAASLWCLAAGDGSSHGLSDENAMLIPDSVWSEGGNCSSPATYKTFLKCHNQPPAKPANREMCSTLQRKVAVLEARNEAKGKGSKAIW